MRPEHLHAIELLIVVFVFPVLEEYVFRAGLLAAADRRWPTHRWRNNWAVSMVFGLAHAPVWGAVHALAVVLPSLGLGWLYQRTGVLWVPMAAHAIGNLLGVLFIF